ncbi:MAG: ABC transporter substrate-binding protein [Oligoflexales bacterium]
MIAFLLNKPIRVLTLVALFLASCTKSCSGSSESSDAPGTTGGKKIFQSFRTSVHRSLDPVKQFDQASAEIVTNLYDTLLSYHYLKRPYQLVPGLLEKMPEAKADDPTTFVFTLRQGVKFIDDPCFADGKGREMTIDDVIYTIKRFADFNENVQSYTLIQGFVVGMEDFREKTKQAGKSVDYATLEIEGVKKTGPYEMTVKFTRDNPLAFFPFAFSGMSIVPHEAVKKYGEDFAQHPVGSGPFYMKDYQRRGTMILAKNPNYWDKYPTDGDPGDAEAGFLKDAGKQLPIVDEVHLPLIEESQPAMLKFLNGEIDQIGIRQDDFNKMAFRDDKGEFHLKGEYAEKYNIFTEVDLRTDYYVFNMKDPLIGKNKALREAIGYALDTGAWIDLLRNGRGVVSDSVVPPAIAGSATDTGSKYYRKNIELAKQKLAEAGYPEGKGLPTLVMEYRSTMKETRQDYEFLRDELAGIGIKIQGNFQTFSAFLQKMDAGNFQISEAAWGADYPDAENFYQLLYGPNVVPGPNTGSYDNPEYNKLYEETKYMKNGPERFEKFKKMNEILKDDVPMFFRYSPIGVGMMQKNLKNSKRNVMLATGYRFYNKE